MRNVKRREERGQASNWNMVILAHKQTNMLMLFLRWIHRLCIIACAQLRTAHTWNSLTVWCNLSLSWRHPRTLLASEITQFCQSCWQQREIRRGQYAGFRHIADVTKAELFRHCILWDQVATLILCRVLQLAEISHYFPIQWSLQWLPFSCPLLRVLLLPHWSRRRAGRRYSTLLMMTTMEDNTIHID